MPRGVDWKRIEKRYQEYRERHMDRFAGEVTESENEHPWGDSWKKSAKLYRDFYKLTLEQAQKWQGDCFKSRRWAKAWKRAAKNWRLWAGNSEVDLDDLCRNLRELYRYIREARRWARRMKLERDEERQQNRKFLAANIQLVADNARLRELIKSVGEDSYCRWCGGFLSHSPDCPAFDSEGNVR